MLFLAGLTIAAVQAAAPATSPQAAAQLIEQYYAAIDRGDYRAAYGAWDRKGAASGKSFAQFQAGFAQTRSVRVVVGVPTNADAGMSQRWIEVPVDVHATLKSGKGQHFRGAYTLRRVVPGVGAPAQLRWHIASARLAPVKK